MLVIVLAVDVASVNQFSRLVRRVRVARVYGQAPGFSEYECGKLLSSTFECGVNYRPRAGS
jgi:hypothetical protein